MSGFWSVFVILCVVITLGLSVWLLLTNTKGKIGETTGHKWDEDLEEYNNPLPRWWLWLFYITIVFSIGYVIYYPGLGSYAGVGNWTQAGEHAEEVAEAEAKYGPLFAELAAKPIPELAKDPKALKMGQRIFLNYCSTCHGSDAGGGPGFPNLTDDEWLYGGDPAAIKTTVLNGRSGVMPAMGAALGKDGVDQVAQYVISLSGRDHDAAKAVEGKGKFQAFCAACHGAEGKGMAVLGAPDLTNNAWLYGGSLTVIKKTIDQGRNGVMPAHKGIIGEDKAHIVSAYIYSLTQ